MVSRPCAGYRVTSFVYHARLAFDPACILAVLNGDLPGVIRAKGHFCLATRSDRAAEFSMAGALSEVRPLGRGWAAVPQTRWPRDPDQLQEIEGKKPNTVGRHAKSISRLGPVKNENGADLGGPHRSPALGDEEADRLEPWSEIDQ